jgi:hypothetical protein
MGEAIQKMIVVPIGGSENVMMQSRMYCALIHPPQLRSGERLTMAKTPSARPVLF